MTAVKSSTRPTLTPVVYLRGAGRKPDLWQAIEAAMWAHGWVTQHDRTTAWHAAHNGVPVVFVDFSAVLDAAEVGLVRARYRANDGYGAEAMELVLQSQGLAADRPRDTLPDRLAALADSALTGTLPEPAPDDRVR